MSKRPSLIDIVISWIPKNLDGKAFSRRYREMAVSEICEMNPTLSKPDLMALSDRDLAERYLKELREAIDEAYLHDQRDAIGYSEYNTFC